jgi:hypothetical protein
MGDDGNLFDAWKRRPPAFLAHIEAEASNGSGIQVDPAHVVTCAHVFRRNAPENQRDVENFYLSRGRITNVTQRTAVIRFGGFEAQGTVIAQHEFLDLVLVRLPKSRPCVASPFFWEQSPQGNGCAVGVIRTGAGLECLQQPVEIDRQGASQGTTETQIKFTYGPREGTSGGGVFGLRENKLVLIGIAQIGGELSMMGGCIPASAVFEFLKKELGFENPPHPAGKHKTQLLWAGITPNWEFEDTSLPLKLSFAAILPKAGPASFISRRAIAAREMRLRTEKQILPGHRRLAAWANKIEEAEAAVLRLAGISGLRLRLPTPEELEFSWRLQTPASAAPEGRPLTLADFKPNEFEIDVPPAGIYEWARGRNGKACAIGPGSEPERFPSIAEDQVDYLEPGFRVAFDAEEA